MLNFSLNTLTANPVPDMKQGKSPCDASLTLSRSKLVTANTEAT